MSEVERIMLKLKAAPHKVVNGVERWSEAVIRDVLEKELK